MMNFFFRIMRWRVVQARPVRNPPLLWCRGAVLLALRANGHVA